MFRILACLMFLGAFLVSDAAIAQHNHAPGETCPECEKMGFGHGAPGSCGWSEDPAALSVPDTAPDFSPPALPVETDSTALVVILFSAIIGVVLLTIRGLQVRQSRAAG